MDGELMRVAFSADDLVAVDDALTVLESRLGQLWSLRPEMRRGWARMGEASEAFCRRTLAALRSHPQSAGECDLAWAQADLAAADALHPRLQRLRRLCERAEDTEMALGCDVMVAALQGHAWLRAVENRFDDETLCVSVATGPVAWV